MLTNNVVSTAANNDAELVRATLSGDREGFGQIVARYQGLICGLTYNATGNLSQSEDLAQETFVTAWKRLTDLHEPEKLRSWLCGIARNLSYNSQRKHKREPSHAAEPIEEISESHSPEPLPIENTITNEEQAILWRSLEKIPETYREPLVLFYRENQSAEAVAEKLELPLNTVHQRLSRGRKLLAAEVTAFVEGALARTKPGKAFTLGVLAALPVTFATSAKAATLSAAVAKGGSAAKTAAGLGMLGSFFGPVMGFFGMWVGYRAELDRAKTETERQLIREYFRPSAKLFWGFFVAVFLVVELGFKFRSAHPAVYSIIVVSLVTLWVGLNVTRGMRFKKKLEAFRAEQGGAVVIPRYEYRSKTTWLGLPLIHVRIVGGGSLAAKPVRGWIAVGNQAQGSLFAAGMSAFAPVSVGLISIGLVSFGCISVGLLAIGAVAGGVLALGGMGVGWMAWGGSAVAWKAAAGGVAFAREFAIGGLAIAAQANNEAVNQFMKSSAFFRTADFLARNTLWVNLLMMIPLIVCWRLLLKKRPKQH